MSSPQERFEEWQAAPCSPKLSHQVREDPQAAIDAFIETAFLAGYAAGAEDMQERAAHGLAVAFRGTAVQLSMQHPEWGIGLSAAARDPVAWLRALPLSPEPSPTPGGSPDAE